VARRNEDEGPEAAKTRGKNIIIITIIILAAASFVGINRGFSSKKKIMKIAIKGKSVTVLTRRACTLRSFPVHASRFIFLFRARRRTTISCFFHVFRGGSLADMWTVAEAVGDDSVTVDKAR
jgi:hypothetical protein